MPDPTEEEQAAARAAEEAALAAAAEADAAKAAEEAAAAAALNDPGKKALDAMKAERKAARDEAAAAKAERDALQAKLDGREAEYAAEQQRNEAKAEALQGANQRILRSEIRAAAKGVLADPADAFKFLNLDDFTVGDDGEVDEADIASKLQALVTDKPYLAAAQGDQRRFTGTGDAGPLGTAGKPQLTQADVKRLSAEGKHREIEQARVDGRLNILLGIK